MYILYEVEYFVGAVSIAQVSPLNKVATPPGPPCASKPPLSPGFFFFFYYCSLFVLCFRLLIFMSFIVQIHPFYLSRFRLKTRQKTAPSTSYPPRKFDMFSPEAVVSRWEVYRLFKYTGSIFARYWIRYPSGPGSHHWRRAQRSSEPMKPVILPRD